MEVYVNKFYNIYTVMVVKKYKEIFYAKHLKSRLIIIP